MAVPDVNGEGQLYAFVGALSEDEAVEIVEWLLDVYFRVHKLSRADEWLGGKLAPI